MKLNKLWVLFLIILFTVLQYSVFNCIKVFNTKPDILLILTVFFSLYFGQGYGLVVGALCGFFSELTSGIPQGAAILVYSLGGITLGYLGRWVYHQTIRSEILITFIFIFTIYFGLFLLWQIFNKNLYLLNTILFLILPASLYTAVISPFLLRFLRFLISLKI